MSHVRVYGCVCDTNKKIEGEDKLNAFCSFNSNNRNMNKTIKQREKTDMTEINV